MCLCTTNFVRTDYVLTCIYTMPINAIVFFFSNLKYRFEVNITRKILMLNIVNSKEQGTVLAEIGREIQRFFNLGIL